MEITIFTYYFPPNSEVGIRRVLYWIDFLLDRGYTINLYTIKHGKIPQPYPDNPNLRIYIMNWKSISLYSKQNGSKIREVNTNTFLKRIKKRIINPLFGQLADPRIIYCLPMLLHLRKIETKAQLTIATSPPYFIIVLAWLYSSKKNLPFIIDYRDQFSNNPMFSGILRSVETRIDKKLIHKATCIVSVSEPIVNYYNNLGAKRTKCIYNGYDEKIFKAAESNSNLGKNRLIMTYVGSIVHKSRIPKNFLNWLETFKHNYEIHLYGDTELLLDYVYENHPRLQKKIITKKNLEYSKVPLILAKSDVNLVFEEKQPRSSSQFGTIPTKVYEYMAIRRPIISEMSNELEGYKLLKQSGLLLHNFSEENLSFNLKNLDIQPNNEFILSFSRLRGAEELEAEISFNIGN